MSELIKFNDREYSFDCGVVSHRLDDALQTTASLAPISYNTLQELVINDSLFDPFLDATLTIKTKGSGVEATPLLGFQFFSNNNNGVVLKIQPTDIQGTDVFFLTQNTLEFYGVVGDQTVYGSDSSIEQLQQFTLCDVKEARLKETKLAAVNIPSVTQSKSIVKNINNITKRIIGEDILTEGTSDSNNINNSFDYVFPSHFNGFDAINFLIPYNISIVNNLPVQNILRYDYTRKHFTSTPVVQPLLTPRAESSNIETFILGGDESVQLPELNRGDAPAAPVPQIISPNNRVNNIAYSNVSYNIANNDLLPICVLNTVNPYNVTSMVYIDLEEQIKLFDNNIIKQDLARIYGNNVRLNVDLDIHKLKNNKLNYKIVNTNLNINTAVDIAKAQLYNSFIFQNMYMVFTVPGQPYREPGKFINIKPLLLQNTGTATERKLVGQWLVTEVKHVFTGDGKYNNIIQCVKPFINK
jgi:hypothetical protein